MTFPISRIISGGQTGADRGGLEAALSLGLPHGGWCPKGRLAEDGVVPARFQLRETASANYLVRTKRNVIEADLTLVVTVAAADGGSKRTIEFARELRRPFLALELREETEEKAALSVVSWLEAYEARRRERPEFQYQPLTLNVAGSRESKAPGIQDRVRGILVRALGAEVPRGG